MQQKNIHFLMAIIIIFSLGVFATIMIVRAAGEETFLYYTAEEDAFEIIDGLE